MKYRVRKHVHDVRTARFGGGFVFTREHDSGIALGVRFASEFVN